MSEWTETGDVCSACGYNGLHLSVDDGDLIYCGRCDTQLDDD